MDQHLSTAELVAHPSWPICGSNLELPNDMIQLSLVWFVDAKWLLFQRDGFFIESGALDGETRSNSLFFERFRGWTGLLIEAGPINYQQILNKHRNAYTVPICIGVTDYPEQVNCILCGDLSITKMSWGTVWIFFLQVMGYFNFF